MAEKISCVIITLNEERNIARCLASVKNIADEIIVVDSFSTDNTESICKDFNVKFIQSIWKGYSETKNLGNTSAQHNWILSLDADEELSDVLQQSILTLKANGQIISAKFNRLTNYCGHWIHHSGWYPDTKFRLFDRRITYWKGEVHEQLESSQPVEIIKLKGDCHHYSYYHVNEHYKQIDKYSTLGAQQLYNRNKRTNALVPYLKAIFKFFRNYIIKLGFLDGKAGFSVCRLVAYETYLKYNKLWMLQKRNKTH